MSEKDQAELEDHGLAAIPDYPLAALPPAADGLVGYCQHSGLPLALLGGAALAALAGALGPNAELEVWPGWHERAGPAAPGQRRGGRPSLGVARHSEPPRAGIGSGSKPAGLRKRTGGFSIVRNPSGPMSTSCQAPSARSR